MRERLPPIPVARSIALSLACFVVIGFLLGRFLERRIEDRAAAHASDTASLLAAQVATAGRAGGRRSGTELGPGGERALERLLASAEVRDEIRAVKLWSRSGRILHAADASLEGRTFPLSPDLRAALGGRTVSKFELEDEDEAGEREEVFEVYTPLRAGARARPAGVLELYFRARPVRAEVARQRRILYTGLAVGLIALYGALLHVAIVASRRLRASYRRARSVAEELQHAALPERLPDAPGVALAARYRPGAGAVQVGGDWYDAVSFDDGRLAVVIGDVSGHGIGAARLMAELRGALHVHLVEAACPATALAGANAYVRRIAPGRIATAVVCVWDELRGEVSMASAGHLPPLLVGPEGGARLLEVPTGPPLGAHAVAEYRERRAALAAGSRLVLYTDGLVEDRRRPLREQVERLRAAAERSPAELEPLCDHLLRALGGDGERPDDVALLALEARRVAGERLEIEFPADPARLATVRRQLRRWLDARGAEPAAAHRLLLACGEACANAIEHPYGLGAATVRLVARIDGDHAEVEVADHGRWRSSPPEAGRGRGLALMKRVVDRLELRRGPGGTTVRLRHRVRSGRAGDGSRRPEAERPANAPAAGEAQSRAGAASASSTVA